MWEASVRLCTPSAPCVHIRALSTQFASKGTKVPVDGHQLRAATSVETVAAAREDEVLDGPVALRSSRRGRKRMDQAEDLGQKRGLVQVAACPGSLRAFTRDTYAKDQSSKSQ